MSFALQPTSIIPVLVTRDWSTADNAALDVADALEASFPGVFQFPLASNITITGLQIQNGITYKGVLVITADTGAGTWSTGFAVAYPAVGSTAYIIDMY